MADCSLLNLGSCLPQKFFEFLQDLVTAPTVPFLNLAIKLLSEPVNLNIFSGFWVIMIYMISLFYSLLLVGTGISFMLSGHDVAKREKSKQWLRDIVVMIVLIQASFFIYQLAIDLSSAMTSATLTLLDEDFFALSVGDLSDLALSITLGAFYTLMLLVTSLILVIRYAIVSVGVVFFPLAIFFYFLSPLKQYGSLILNFLGIAIFVTFFDAVLLIGFAELKDLAVFGEMKVMVLISAFAIINILMLLLMFFSVVKAGFSVYGDVKKIGAKI